MAETPNSDSPHEADPINLEAMGTKAVACPNCGAEMPGELIESHLQTTHGLYAFHDVLRSFNETLSAALTALTGPTRDRQAWKVLLELAHEGHGPRAFAFLATSITQVLHKAPSKTRSRSISNVASVIARTSEAKEFLASLADEDQVT